MCFISLHDRNIKNKIAVPRMELDEVTCCERFGVGVVLYKSKATSKLTGHFPTGKRWSESATSLSKQVMCLYTTPCPISFIQSLEMLVLEEICIRRYRKEQFLKTAARTEIG